MSKIYMKIIQWYFHQNKKRNLNACKCHLIHSAYIYWCVRCNWIRDAINFLMRLNKNKALGNHLTMCVSNELWHQNALFCQLNNSVSVVVGYVCVFSILFFLSVQWPRCQKNNSYLSTIKSIAWLCKDIKQLKEWSFTTKVKGFTHRIINQRVSLIFECVNRRE